jgi:Tol biopolymer transport system component
MTRWLSAAAVTAATALGLVCVADPVRLNGFQIDAKTRATAEATLAKAIFEATAQRLTVFDRQGKVVQTLGEPAQYRWPVLSPDGTRIAFVRQNVPTKSQDLYVLERANGAVIQLTSDTASESSPVWSPDGRRIAYVSDRGGKPAIYRRAAAATQEEELLYRLPGTAALSDWSPDGRYLAFSILDTAAWEKLNDLTGVRAGLFTLRLDPDSPNAPRSPTPVLSGERLKVLGGRFSPDGKFLAFRSNQSGSNQIWVVGLDAEGRINGEPRQVSVHGALGMATWRRDGREMYFFSADKELMAVSVTTGGTTRFGTPKRLFETGHAIYAFYVSDWPFVGAPDGLGSIGRDGREVVFISVPAPRGREFARQLTVFNRSGKVLRTLGEPADYSQPVFSPDARRVAVYRNRAMWVFDISSGKDVQITPGGLGYSVAWSPDGRDVAYAGPNNDQRSLYRRPADGSGAARMLYTHAELGVTLPLTDWSPDGRFFSFNGGNVLWTVSAIGQGTAFRLPPADFNVFGGRMSPDGHYIAYVSDESGAKEIYVRQFDSVSGFPAPGFKRQVSNEGGLGMVQWRSDGRELYYLDRDGNVMAVDVVTSPSFEAGSPKRLFRLPDTFPLNRTNYPDCSCATAGGCEQGHISRDGEKFVFAIPIPPSRQEITVPTESLARYAGTYTLAGADVRITLEGNGLVFDRGTKARLFAESESRFFLKATNGDLEFFKDDDGDVPYFLIYTGEAPRLAIRK